MSETGNATPVYTMKEGDRAGSSAGYRPSDGKKGSEKQDYDRQIEKLLKELGLRPEEEEDLLWMRGLSPGYFNTFSQGGMAQPGYGNTIMLNPDTAGYLAGRQNGGRPEGTRQGVQQYSTPMRSMTRSRHGNYLDSGHNADIAIQYVAPDGGRYNMNVKTTLDSTADSLYGAMLGFYGMIAAQANGKEGKEQYGQVRTKGGSYKGSGYRGGGKAYGGSGYGARGGYAGGKGGS
jgi:hypothetical protein